MEKDLFENNTSKEKLNKAYLELVKYLKIKKLEAKDVSSRFIYG
jgi:hypothetical protein